jgi:cellulose biosynthesis protein BcsQ
MQFKIDTKERFRVVTVQENFLSATMAEELSNNMIPYLQNVGENGQYLNNDNANIVLVLKEVKNIENEAGETLCQLQQKFYEHQASFVICDLQPAVEKMLDELSLLEVMNVTPTESEAWDIVQMEEIERELLGDDTENL